MTVDRIVVLVCLHVNSADRLNHLIGIQDVEFILSWCLDLTPHPNVGVARTYAQNSRS